MQLKTYYLSESGKQEVQKVTTTQNKDYTFQKRPFVSRPKTLYVNLKISTHHRSSRVPCHTLCWTLSLKATMARLVASFYWTGMYRDVKSFIKQCLLCQQNKPINTKPLGLLQPIPPPTQIWDELTTDFITHLSSSFGHSHMGCM